MKKNNFYFVLVLISVCSLPVFHSLGQKNQKDKPLTESPSFHRQIIGQPRQISVVGTRSGEAYYSPDGQHIIFQSERMEGNPFYQIYQMNLQTGQSELLSTGQGKTTCAWFHPNMKKALFSSTHKDKNFSQKVQEEFDIRKNPVQGRYSWSFDETFDIFEVDLKSKKLKPLTQEIGYDAEASYSPDGKTILFASNRGGYKNSLTPEEKILFEKDPSSQMEIYIMNADGSGVKQLTNHLGYDGGPFFSADGKLITWRRFNRLGTYAEIWVMNADGSEPRPLTSWQSMSWAPYFHPSGDYIVFTSNKLGYQNFELYIIDTQGTQEPVRVTFQDGFDGLPVFSPDGQEILWSHRNNKGESQLMLAPWDDSLARKALGLPPKFPLTQAFKKEPNEKLLRTLVEYIAGPEMEGRLVGSEGEKKLAKDISSYFSELGLSPYFGNSFTQEFSFVSAVHKGKNNKLTLSLDKPQSLKLDKDFSPYSFSQKGIFSEAPVAFAGYGMIVPENEKFKTYNSYQDLDVKGKWVLVLRDIPEDIPNDKRIYFNQFSRLHHKAMLAKQQGAIGLLVAKGPRSYSKKELSDLRFEGAGTSVSLPVINITDEVAQKILNPSKIRLEEWQKQLDKGDIRGASVLQNIKLAAEVDLEDKASTGRNVLGFLPMPGAKKTFVIGAHGDHLGRGEAGSSLARGSQVGQIHYGADDNASGVATVLMLARYFEEQKKQGLKLPFHLAFAIWSGEEVGLLGSHAFLKENTKPLYAYVNFDMVGRLDKNLFIQGLGSAKEWKPYLESLSVQTPISLQFQDDPYVPTDAMAFYLNQVPILSFFTGAHGEYHTPLDKPETLNYKGLGDITQLGYRTIEFLGQQEGNKINKKRPHQPLSLTYQKVEGGLGPNSSRRFRVFIGTIPDYVQEKTQGVKISGTSKDSPAEKAGLKSGDIITQVDQLNIENLYDYVYALQALKPERPIKLKVIRANKKFELEVTPVLRE